MCKTLTQAVQDARIDKPKLSDYIWVCEKCRQASCWAGIFMCWESGNADVIKVAKAELLAENLEHPSYLDREEVQA